ncbi:hypothetical protein ABIC09_006399 [Bradyrhizobium sp. S3.12.5]
MPSPARWDIVPTAAAQQDDDRQHGADQHDRHVVVDANDDHHRQRQHQHHRDRHPDSDVDDVLGAPPISGSRAVAAGGTTLRHVLSRLRQTAISPLRANLLFGTDLKSATFRRLARFRKRGISQVRRPNRAGSRPQPLSSRSTWREPIQRRHRTASPDEANEEAAWRWIRHNQTPKAWQRWRNPAALRLPSSRSRPAPAGRPRSDRSTTALTCRTRFGSGSWTLPNLTQPEFEKPLTTVQ